MEDTSYAETTVAIGGEEIKVDAVKDPRLGKMGQWHARGVYKTEYVMAQGDSLSDAFRNWETKARSL